MTYFRGLIMCAVHLSESLRQARPRLRVTWGGLLAPQVRRLFEVAKPLLIVVMFLLILGLAGGVEQGTVWP